MNKNTKKKVYVAPQMTVLKMNTNCQLLQESYWYQKLSPEDMQKARSYKIIDFD